MSHALTSITYLLNRQFGLINHQFKVTRQHGSGEVMG